MDELKGKVIKISLNSSYGLMCVTGPFIALKDNFVEIISRVSKKIEYYSIYNIKSISIIGDINSEEDNQ